MEKQLPRILLAAPKSGSGKTMITCGLLNLLKRQFNKVISYKCGPDYIDPMFHRKVLGIDGGNLDSYFMDENGIRNILGNTDAEIVVIEGVMGIYDGLELNSRKASAYDIASITNTPIILIVDGKGAGRTIISSIKGILIDDDNRLIKGIIINNISKSYFEKLKPVIEGELENAGFDVKLVGNLPNIKNVHIDSRHLGLMLPDEIENLNETIDTISNAINENCKLEMILEIMNNTAYPISKIACSQKEFERAALKNESQDKKKLRLAIARDEAFCFYYKENLEVFLDKNVELVEFSPIHNSHLPENIDGLLLGGGYPENYLEKLSNNKSMLEDIYRKLQEGIPTLAECGGFIYLHNSAKDVNGNEYKLVGYVDGECSYTGHLVRFGYVELNPATDIAEGTKTDKCSKVAEIKKESLSSYIKNMKGHEFHYYDSSNNGNSLIARKPSGEKSWTTGISDERCLLAFPHLYYQSNPEFIDAFIDKMNEYKGT